MKRAFGLGVTLIGIVLVGDVRADDQANAIAPAQQRLDAGLNYLQQGDFGRAEKSLREALQMVDRLGDSRLPRQARVIRMQCLRSLTQLYYSSMRDTHCPQALATGLRYDTLLRRAETHPREVGIRNLCENALHLARIYMFLEQDAQAEQLLRGIQLPAEMAERNPPLTLDIALHRAQAARRLAEQVQVGDQWAQVARRRWRAVETETCRVLQQLAQPDSSELRKLARRYRPELAERGLLDQAVTELRTLLQQAVAGPDAVLLLVRLSAHMDQLRVAEQLSRELLEHCQDAPPVNPLLLPEVLNQLGVIEATLGDSDHAVQHLRQAISTCQQRLDDAGDCPRASIVELLATSHDQLATVLAAQGYYGHAERCCEESLRYWRQLPANTDGITGAIVQLASLEKTLGRSEDAIRLYQEALELKESRSGGGHFDLIELYCALAESHLAQPNEDHLQKAEVHARKAAAIAQIYDDRRGARIARHLLAVIDFRRGQLRLSAVEAGELWDRARSTWEELLAEYLAANDRLGEGRVLRRLGDVSFAQYQLDTNNQDKLKAAQTYYNQATKRLDQIGAPPIARVNALVGLARVLAENESFAAASSCLEKTIQIIDTAGTSFKDLETQQPQFCEQFTEVYDLLTRCLLAENDVERMLHYAEQFRNRILREEIQRSDAEMPPSSSVSSFEGRLGNEFAFLRAHVDRYEKLLPTPGLNELQESLRQLQHQEDIILYYYLGDDASYVCVITDQQLRQYPLIISPAQSQVLFESPSDKTEPLTWLLAAQMVGEYVRIIEDRSLSIQFHLGANVAAADGGHFNEAQTRPKRSFDREASIVQPWFRALTFVESMKRRLKPFGPDQARVLTATLLSDDVFNQVTSNPNRFRHVIIVADPVLQRLPFHALPVGPRQRGPGSQQEQQYLFDYFPPICYAPSIQVLHLLQTRDATRRPGGQVLPVGSCLSELPEVERECHEIARHFPQQVVRPLLVGPRATEGLLRMYAPTSWLIFFAGHAEFPDGRNELERQIALRLSASRFRRNDLPADNNGTLTVSEIYDMDLSYCEAVVLSACSTLRSKMSLLDSGKSLARAFLVAGASRVIATYWDVDDDMPRPVMEQLLEYIAERSEGREPIDYAAGLHEAVKRAKRINPSPYHWACFALVGPPVARHRWNPPQQLVVAHKPN